MKLDNIKGYIEINGIRYDAREIIRKLQSQGIDVTIDREILILGKELIKPSPNPIIEYKSCKKANICRYYEEGDPEGEVINDKSSLNSAVIEKQNSSKKFDGCQPFNVTKDVVRVNDDEFVLPLSKNKDNRINANFYPINYNSNIPPRDEDPIVMKVITPETKYVPPSLKKTYNSRNEMLKKIPPHMQTICPYCYQIISKEWSFCGHCGQKIR